MSASPSPSSRAASRPHPSDRDWRAVLRAARLAKAAPVRQAVVADRSGVCWFLWVGRFAGLQARCDGLHRRVLRRRLRGRRHRVLNSPSWLRETTVCWVIGGKRILAWPGVSAGPGFRKARAGSSTHEPTLYCPRRRPTIPMIIRAKPETKVAATAPKNAHRKVLTTSPYSSQPAIADASANPATLTPCTTFTLWRRSSTVSIVRVF